MLSKQVKRKRETISDEMDDWLEKLFTSSRCRVPSIENDPSSISVVIFLDLLSLEHSSLGKEPSSDVDNFSQ
jgi:hypothetical protein